MQPNYVKPFKLIKVLDGSTYIGVFDLGFGIRVKKKLKLINIQCHNLKVERGRQIKDKVSAMLKGKQLNVQTFYDRFGKYSTVLGVIYINDNGSFINLNDEMVKMEMAVNLKNQEITSV